MNGEVQRRHEEPETRLCLVDDLIPLSGVAVMVGGKQIAVFYLPDEQPSVFALDNYDPKGQANVLSRGIVGDWKGDVVVASPLYKQHYRLSDGVCVEDAALSVGSYPVTLRDGVVYCNGVFGD